MFWTTKVLKVLLELVLLVRSILKILRLRQPGMVFVRVLSEDGPMLKFVLQLPPVEGSTDVVSRKITVSIAGADAQEITLPASALVTDVMNGEQDDTVIGQLVDIDDAGNASTPSAFSFVLADTLPPAQPGQVGLQVTEEV